MAVGALALAEKEAIVTKLEAIEEMAGTDVLCIDKTGTLTKNEITVTEIKSFSGFSDDDVMTFAALASRKEDNDPIEAAIFEKTSKGNILAALKSYKVIKFKPFDPVSKRTEATCQNLGTGGTIITTKGASQAILSLLGPGGAVSNDINSAVEEFASRGYRTIAVAEGTLGSGFQIAGLIALYDPPREDSKETIAAAEKMGVDVKMVTGDHMAIAMEMCKEVGIGTNIVRAQVLQDPATNGSAIENANAFAEIFPEHKYAIVDILQKRGHIVGMTGDGVNDAPALKKADAGIAVSGATDAARSAADIVLTRPGLSVIIDAIKQSRMIFERMNNYAIYRISETIRVLLFIAFSILIFNFYPLTVLMLVFLALLNDIPIMMIAYDNVRVHDKPVRWDMRSVLGLSSFLGVAGLISSFLMLLLGTYVFHLNIPTLETLMFLKLVVAGHMTLYLARTGRKHFWSRPLPARRLFLTLEITQLVATVFVASGILMTPLSWTLILFVWGYAFAFFIINDFAKVAFIGYMDSRKRPTPQQVVATS
jgi:H+-transporting ATPase